MSIANLGTDLLPYMASYGAMVLGAVLLLGALGLPLPSTFLIITSGALVQQGVLDLFSTLAIALCCVVVGDLLCYSIGRLLRRAILARFGGSARWQRAEGLFQARGTLAIFLTRCLLTAVATPINLVAGSSGYTARRFARVSAAGQLTWLLLYGAVGYLFGTQWEQVSQLLSSASSALLALAVASGLVYWARAHRARLSVQGA